MAFLGLLLFPLLFQTFTGLDVFAPSSQHGLNGSTVVLPCTFSIDKLPLDPKYLAILWSFKGKQILLYDNKGTKKDPRATFDGEATKDGNASLTLANVSLSDGGTYSCLVVYSPDQIQKDIVLEVQVRPTVILYNKTVRKESENTLLCEAAGFFPRDIEITWTLDGKKENNSILGELVENKDGTYSVTSFVTITPTTESKTLSCTVRHASFQDRLQEDLELVYEDRSSAGIIIASSVLVVVILIIIISAVLWKQKKRRKANGPLMLRDIKGPPKLIDGEEAALYGTVDNAPEDLCVTWLIRRAGQEQEIQTSQMREHSEEEEESLLDTSYVIKSQVVGRQYSSSLSFIPHMERHKDVTFICRGVSGKHKEEKSFLCKTIFGKPKMSQPIMRSLFVCGEMKYLLNLEKFYPKSIKIFWTCGEKGKEEAVSSTDSISENPDRSYNVCSEINIPEDQHKYPGFRVRVTWEHESMEEPESRELNIRDSDYSWTPVVEEILIPRLLLGSPAVLQCNISEYFPDAVTVKWMRRDGDQSHEETNDNQRITSRRAADNTYSRTASLTITPDLRTHQGAEYVCLVEHPSLETPIGRSTGPLQVYGKPQMSAPIEITMADSSRVRFSQNLQKFYPKDIKISWSWEDKFGEYGLSPVETISVRDDDLTYEVTSVVYISVHPFKDPDMEIIVEWEHERTETSERRSLSVRDLPWHPNVGSINVPELEDGKSATLTCDISGYFPDPLTVIWFTKKDGDETELPRESSNVDRIYKMSEKEKRQKDNTYSCEASLTFTPINSDQASEIICRVKHPSEECPIERSTGPLHIGERKQNNDQIAKQDIGSVTQNPMHFLGNFSTRIIKTLTVNKTDVAEEAEEKSEAELQEETKILAL